MKVLYVNALTEQPSANIAKEGVIEGLRKAVPNAELISMDIFVGDSLQPPHKMGQLARAHQVNAVILSGSEKNTTDHEDPWLQDYYQGLRDLLDFRGNLEDWIGPEFPILGICFGHQALACVLGGQTSKFKTKTDLIRAKAQFQAHNHPVTKELLKDKSKTEQSFLLPVFHGDHVVRLPYRFHSLCTSDYCDVQAMAHDIYPIISFQPHPEFTPKMMEHVDEKPYWAHTKVEDWRAHDGPNILSAFAKWVISRSR